MAAWSSSLPPPVDWVLFSVFTAYNSVEKHLAQKFVNFWVQCIHWSVGANCLDYRSYFSLILEDSKKVIGRMKTGKLLSTPRYAIYLFFYLFAFVQCTQSFKNKRLPHKAICCMNFRKNPSGKNWRNSIKFLQSPSVFVQSLKSWEAKSWKDLGRKTVDSEMTFACLLKIQGVHFHACLLRVGRPSILNSFWSR